MHGVLETGMCFIVVCGKKDIISLLGLASHSSKFLSCRALFFLHESELLAQRFSKSIGLFSCVKHVDYWITLFTRLSDCSWSNVTNMVFQNVEDQGFLAVFMSSLKAKSGHSVAVVTLTPTLTLTSSIGNDLQS